MRKAIAYTRVSTSEQGNSGLGLAAQRNAIESFARAYGYEITGNDWLEEIASGKTAAMAKRPVLADAVRRARRSKATLIVAKLDRLSRSTHFVTGLLDDKRVRFRVADVGDEADNTLLRILAVFAEREREQIGKRTSEALQEAKKRGVTLGNQTNLREVALRGAVTNARQADEFAATILPRIERIRAAGRTTYRDIANALNDLGVKTARDGEWHGMSVRRLIERAKGNQADPASHDKPTPAPRSRKKRIRSLSGSIANPARPKRTLEF